MSNAIARTIELRAYSGRATAKSLSRRILVSSAAVAAVLFELRDR